MARITPTIGRIVLAHVDTGSRVQVLPAMITRVSLRDIGPHRINAKVFCDSISCDGSEFVELYGAPILEPGEDRENNEYREWCEWMPYQKGQAALTEAIAKKAGINA